MKETLETIIKNIVENQEAVSINEKQKQIELLLKLKLQKLIWEE